MPTQDAVVDGNGRSVRVSEDGCQLAVQVPGGEAGKCVEFEGGLDDAPQRPFVLRTERPDLATHAHRGGRSRANPPSAAPYASKRRKTTTAFCPPKPKPLMIAVSTFLARFTFGM